jgi:hypothetical protein
VSNQMTELRAKGNKQLGPRCVSHVSPLPDPMREGTG